MIGLGGGDVDRRSMFVWYVVRFIVRVRPLPKNSKCFAAVAETILDEFGFKKNNIQRQATRSWLRSGQNALTAIRSNVIVTVTAL